MNEENIDYVYAIEEVDGRAFLNSYNKISFWINKKFKEQEGVYYEPIIDLSNVIIFLHNGLYPFDLTKLTSNTPFIIPIEIERGFRYEVLFEIDFSNSIIYNLRLCNISFCKNVKFEKTIFFAGVDFRGLIFLDDISFTQIDISQSHTIEDLPLIKGLLSFKLSTFKGEVNFNALLWDSSDNFHFSDNTYEKDVKFMFCKVNSMSDCSFDFTNSQFNGNVLFEGSGRNSSSINSSLSQIDFSNSHFRQKLKIIYVELGEVIMQNCHFYNTVNITHNSYKDTFYLDFSFSSIKCLFFIDSDLGDDKGEIINLKESISFHKALINSDAFVFIRNVNFEMKDKSQNGEIDLSYSNILGTVAIQDTQLTRLNLDKSTIIGHVNVENVNVENYINRGTVTRLKNESLKRNDSIAAIGYKSIEIEYYKRELSDKYDEIFKEIKEKYLMRLLKGSPFIRIRLWKRTKNSCKWVKNLGAVLYQIPVTERILLFLNTASNKNGLSWSRGIIFTMLVSFIFFVLINYFGVDNEIFRFGWVSWSSFGEVWKSYMQVLDVLNFNNELKNFEFNAIGTILFFLSKIFIAYGVYQTISAFRKYGK